MIELAGPLSESPGESFSRLFFAEHGIEQPQQQVEVRDGDGRLVARVDFLWPGRRPVVGEFDGLLKYDDPGALRGEKLRQEALEALGFVVVRWTWSDLRDQPYRTRRRLLAALERRDSW